MKTKTHRNITIDADLLAEFEADCMNVGGQKGFQPTSEQAEIIKAIYPKIDCNRKVFVEKFKEKYGCGCDDSIRKWCQTNGISIERRRG